MNIRFLFLTLTSCCVLTLHAQEVAPNIVLKATPDGTKTLTLSLKTLSGTMPVAVDWGDGVKQNLTGVPAFTTPAAHNEIGLPKGSGTIKVYGADIAFFSCSFTKGGVKLTEVNVTGATELLDLDISSHGLSSIDLSKNTKLTRFTSDNNAFETINLTLNTELLRISMQKNKLKNLDLGKNTKLTHMHLGENELTELDLKANEALTDVYLFKNKLTSLDFSKNKELKFLNVAFNRFKSLDVSMLSKLGRLFCQGNQLTTLELNTVATTWANFIKNKLAPKALPPAAHKDYRYAPQDTILALPAKEIAIAKELDLSGYDQLLDKAGVPQATVYKWKLKSGKALVEGEDYRVEAAKTTFLKLQSEEVYCELTSPAYPLFSGANVMKTAFIRITQTNALETLALAGLRLQTAPGSLHVSGLQAGDRISVYNLAGQRLLQLTSIQNEVELPLPAGVYLLSVNGKTLRIAQP